LQSKTILSLRLESLRQRNVQLQDLAACQRHLRDRDNQLYASVHRTVDQLQRLLPPKITLPHSLPGAAAVPHNLAGALPNLNPRELLPDRPVNKRHLPGSLQRHKDYGRLHLYSEDAED
jgi:hypothetical protein